MAARRGPRPARLLAWSLWAMVAVLAAAYPVLYFLVRNERLDVFGLPGATASAGFVMASVGVLVALRMPRHPIGWLLLVAGSSTGGNATSSLYTIYAVFVAPQAAPAGVFVGWLSGWDYIPGIGALAASLLFFPDGKLPSPRWRVVAIGLFAANIGWTVSMAAAMPLLGATFIDHSGQMAGLTPGRGAAFDTTYTVGLSATGAALILSFVALALRFRSARGVQRQQLRWVATTAALIPVTFIPLILIGAGLLKEVQPVAYVTVAFAMNALPASIGLSVLRYRLYDIDIVINRAVVYGGLAVAITAVYLGLIIGVGSLVGSQGNLVLTVIATAIVGLAFQPARAQLQRYANRVVYGKRATPYEVLSTFSERVAESVAIEELPLRMARILADATAAERADVWLRIGDEIRPAAAWPETAPRLAPVRVQGQVLPAIPGSDRALPVIHQGELLGALSVVKRANDGVTPVEDKLLSDLAHQAGLVLRNVRLTAELLERLEELRASRQRLVAAQDEERRRLERNLHDGAQQNLVALKVKLSLLENIAEQQPGKAKQLAGELKADADETLGTLRDLARGIYPPLLADKGLAAALEAQARKATVPVVVDANGIDRYPQEIEAAVYFCVLEALQNVQKYASATTAHVILAAPNGRLEFTVADDGGGFDSKHVAKGAGLQNMVDRLEALGGELQIVASPGQGTRVVGALPISAAGDASHGGSA